MQRVRFPSVLNEMIPARELTVVCEKHAPQPRTRPKISATQVVTGLIFHQLHDAGTLADPSGQLHGVRMSDSAYAQRRQLLPGELFEEIMLTALQPLADESRQPECFYEGYRLLGIDGTQWSVSNTPAILEQLPKAASRRLQAAFAKLRLVCAIELETHAPVAAVAAAASEWEQTLAKRLWERVPGNSLVIADRLFGAARTLDEALSGTAGRDVAFLLRIRDNIGTQVLERLPDGSALVQVPVREGSRIVKQLKVREIRAKGIGANGKRFTLRLWTTLADPKRYAAASLARQYAERWEHELYYRELKLDVRSAPVLASHTVETALQEVAALVLASAVIARVRVQTADGLKTPARRLSFYKLLLATRQLWAAFELAGGSFPPPARQRIRENYMENVRYTAILPERRARSCLRVLRQPVRKWPRKGDQPSFTGKAQIASWCVPEVIMTSNSLNLPYRHCA